MNLRQYSLRSISRPSRHPTAAGQVCTAEFFSPVYTAVFLWARVCGLGPILLYVCPHTTIYVAESVDWASCYYMCVLILLYMGQILWIGPHANIFVSHTMYVADSVDWAVDTNYAKGSDAPGTRSKASSKDAAAALITYGTGLTRRAQTPQLHLIWALVVTLLVKPGVKLVVS